MNHPEGSFLRLTTPLRVWSQRFAFLLLIVAAIGMVVLSRADPAFLERFRTTVNDAVVPVLEVMWRPVAAVRNWGEELRRLWALKEENERLKAEIARLEQRAAVARRLESENASFRAMLNFVPEAPSRYISGRVIADSASAFVRSVLVNAGSQNGIRKGQAAINSEGLVGRVADIGERSARILLITDLNSRIPVAIESTRDRAILAGDNSDLPRLLYLPPDSPVEVGQRIVTSGHGGVFPPGLPVGVVSEVSRTGDGSIKSVQVRPFVNWNRVEYVRMVDHETRGLIGESVEPQAAARRP